MGDEDALNVPLQDCELLAELRMTTELMIAGNESDGPLDQAEIDRLLGIRP